LEIFTTGFGGKTASQFFEPLKQAGVQQLVDVRLNNVSQLAGFTKKGDLPYFLRELAGISYRHELQLAPADADLKAYRRREIDWEQYAQRYVELLAERGIEQALAPNEFPERIALLCSEPAAGKCHRRLAAEYLAAHWPGVSVIHL
jgi:uncharacterized protein (DUF488 family)